MRPTDGLSLVFAALADPTRREILARLGEGPASVATLRAPFPISAPAVSQHLAVLERAGLVERTAHSRHRLVTARPERLDEAAEWVRRHRRGWEERLDHLERRIDVLNREGDPMTEQQFTVTRVVDAPRGVVWRLWTDPGELAHWFHPSGMRTLPESVEVDLREGGRYAYTMVLEDGGGETPTGGVYLEVVEPERLVFTWGGAGDATVVEVTLTERGTRTEVALTVRGVAGHPGDGYVHDGWTSALDNLAAHAAR